MLNTKKLLYILPDLAYFAEMLPGKKPHTFTIQNFKQFNGDLVDGNKLHQENIQKLMGRLEEGSYGVILPDEIFTNTIVNVQKESEAEVKKHLTQEVIPSLHINSESHQIETFILSEYKGSFKVQLSTVQRSVLAPFKKAIENSKIKVEKIFPLSWTVKSLVSLEPSISMIQMGENLFMAKHYIGVDQPLSDSIDNLDRFVEAVKTLKGSESSIQTIYLLSNELVEEEFKDKLSEVLPIQQLSEKTEEDAKMPSYVEKAVTSAMRTISIEDFEIPEFDLSKVSAAAETTTETASTVKEKEEKEEKEEASDAKAEEEKEEVQEAAKEEETKEEAAQDSAEETPETAASALPKPGAAAAMPGDEDEPEPEKSKEPEVIEADTIQLDEEEPEVKSPKEAEEKEEKEEETKKELSQAAVQPPSSELEKSSKDTQGSQKAAEESEQEPEDESEEDVLLKFADPASQKIDASDSAPLKSAKKSTRTKNMKRKKVLKNKDGVGNFVKVFLIGLASFAVTVIIGVGIGFGVLKLSQPQTQEIDSPVVDETAPAEVTPEETENSEPTPTPEPEINREELSIKVVNATTQAGYAGETSDQLEEAGYGEITAQNAAGDYEEGFYVLMQEENQALINTLSEDLDMELEFSENVEAEDPNNEYDAVIVLAQ